MENITEFEKGKRKEKITTLKDEKFVLNKKTGKKEKEITKTRYVKVMPPSARAENRRMERIKRRNNKNNWMDSIFKDFGFNADEKSFYLIFRKKLSKNGIKKSKGFKKRFKQFNAMNNKIGSIKCPFCGNKNEKMFSKFSATGKCNNCEQNMFI